MTKAISTETIEWPKLHFVMVAGVEMELPNDKHAQDVVLAHPSVKVVGTKPAPAPAETSKAKFD